MAKYKVKPEDNDRYEDLVLKARGGPLLETDGRGYWSDVQRSVKVKRVEAYLQKWAGADYWYSELKVYFTKRSWDIEKHGLIYTDDTFERGLKAWLREEFGRVVANDIDYSEQGMQGDDYVSLDIGEKASVILLKRFGVKP